MAKHVITTLIPVEIAPHFSTVAGFGLRYRLINCEVGARLMAIANRIVWESERGAGTPVEVPVYWGGNGRLAPCVLLSWDERARRGLAATCGRIANSPVAVSNEAVYTSATLCRDWLRYDARDLSAPVVSP